MDRLRYQPPHPLATEIFRAYDIRGIVDEQLSDAMLYHIGLAVGTQVNAMAKTVSQWVLMAAYPALG